jgi:hypothetical protein
MSVSPSYSKISLLTYPIAKFHLWRSLEQNLHFLTQSLENVSFDPRSVILTGSFSCCLQKGIETAKKEITVLDPKRSNAINIGMTVLPPPRTIKAAILKMDTSIMNREGIEVTIKSKMSSCEHLQF